MTNRSRRGCRRRNRLSVVAAAALILAGSGGMLRSAAGAAPVKGADLVAGTYQLAAEGDAFESTVADPNLPLVQTVSVSPYGASANLSSLGQSLADAGAPYAPVVAGLPSLVNGLGSGGLLPQLPLLPGYTNSSYPTKPSTEEVLGGYDLKASSSPTASAGAAKLGVQLPGQNNPTFFATANTAANADGSVTASATAGIDLINFGQLFDIGNVSSTATLTVPASGPPTVRTTIDLGTITVLGIKNGLTLDGLNLLGVNVPIPVNSTLVALLNTILAATGVHVAYLPQIYSYTDGSTSSGAGPDPTKTLQGVVSGALQFAAQEQLSGLGTANVTETLGRVSVSATSSGGASSSPSGSAGAPNPASASGPTSFAGSPAPVTPSSQSQEGSAPIGTGSVSGVAGSSVSAGSQQPSSGLSPSSATPSSAAPAPSLAGSPATASGAPGASAAAAGPAQVLSPQAVRPSSAVGKATSPGPSSESLYLLLVLGSLVALAGTQLLRLLGVRLSLFRGSSS